MLQYNQTNNNYAQYSNLVESTIMLDYFTKIYAHLKDAEQYYPEFNQWYFDKVISGVISSNREIILETSTEGSGSVTTSYKIDGESSWYSLENTEQVSNSTEGYRKGRYIEIRVTGNSTGEYAEVLSVTLVYRVKAGIYGKTTNQVAIT